MAECGVILSVLLREVVLIRYFDRLQFRQLHGILYVAFVTPVHRQCVNLVPY